VIESQARESRQALGTYLALLSDPDRRCLLVTLSETSGDRDESYRPLDLVGQSDAPEQLRLELHHVHLPKLEASGLIHWHRDAGTVSRGPDWEEVAPLLEFLVTHREQLPEGRL